MTGSEILQAYLDYPCGCVRLHHLLADASQQWVLLVACSDGHRDGFAQAMHDRYGESWETWAKVIVREAIPV